MVSSFVYNNPPLQKHNKQKLKYIFTHNDEVYKNILRYV